MKTDPVIRKNGLLKRFSSILLNTISDNIKIEKIINWKDKTTVSNFFEAIFSNGVVERKIALTIVVEIVK